MARQKRPNRVLEVAVDEWDGIDENKNAVHIDAYTLYVTVRSIDISKLHREVDAKDVMAPFQLDEYLANNVIVSVKDEDGELVDDIEDHEWAAINEAVATGYNLKN